MICEPLELEYASAYLEKYGHQTDIVDLILEKKPLKYFLKNKDYDLVCFTGYLPHVGVIKQYAASVKIFNPAIKTVVGGIHAEVMPGDFIDKNIDFILEVNGLKTLKAVVDSLTGVNLTNNTISGLWTGHPQSIMPETVFDYPFPDRAKTKKYRNRYNYIYHEKCATLKTSFGCPYRCEFCFCPEITKHQYFARDIADVVEEIKTIEEKNIFIVDDNFLFNIKRLKEFCLLLRRERIKKNFILFGRADFIVKHPKILEELKESGLTAVFIGLESFKEEDLKDFNKRTTVAINTQAVNILENLEIYCYSGLIAGLDFEQCDFDNLIKYLNDFQHPAINLQPITPLPGTPLYHKIGSEVCIPRERYELWDMAHILIRPTKMSPRKFYYNILRVYFKTSARFSAHRHILKQYGWKIYLRTLKGAFCITWQYLCLIVNPKIN